MAREYHQGRFTPTNPQKYIGDPKNITYRSSWEKKAMIWFDTNPSILNWGSEEITIPYISPLDSRTHRYYPDFIVKYKNKAGEIKKAIVEIKPHAQTVPPVPGNKKTKTLLGEHMVYSVNTAKWEAAEAYCKRVGAEFIILTEHHLFKGGKP